MKVKYEVGINEARLAMEAMRVELERRGVEAVYAVGDSRGDLVAFERMDKAPLPSIIVAMNKVYAAARERKTTREIGQRIRSVEKGFDVAYWGDPKMLGWAGGVPVVYDGEVIGACSVSGLDQDSDEEIARLGAGVILASLTNMAAE